MATIEQSGDIEAVYIIKTLKPPPMKGCDKKVTMVFFKRFCVKGGPSTGRARPVGISSDDIFSKVTVTTMSCWTALPSIQEVNSEEAETEAEAGGIEGSEARARKR
jgi:hypothetical protein